MFIWGIWIYLVASSFLLLNASNASGVSGQKPEIFPKEEPAGEISAKSGTVRTVYRMKDEYTYSSGEALRLEDLGVGTWDKQVSQIVFKTQKTPRKETQIVHPDDGIKRAQDKTIYGDKDKRRQYYEIPTQEAMANATGVASISKSAERDVLAKGICTAFLIAKDRVLTASHCINGEDFRVKVIRFNDQWKGEGFLDQIDSYEIESVDVWDRSYDLAVARIRQKNGALPGDKYKILQLQKSEPAPGSSIYLIGHSGYDYKKYTECHYLIKPYIHPDGKHTFGIDCDAFGGNSGSPVISAETHKVIGVFWGGQKDTRIIKVADKKNHEFVVPMWEVASTNKFMIGTWPKDVSFALKLLYWFVPTS